MCLNQSGHAVEVEIDSSFGGRRFRCTPAALVTAPVDPSGGESHGCRWHVIVEQALSGVEYVGFVDAKVFS